MGQNRKTISKQAIAPQPCFWCGRPTDWAVPYGGKHHVFRRSNRPDLIDEETNLVPLCFECHTRTETNQEFYLKIQQYATARNNRDEEVDNVRPS
jgi:hypothetical protein